MARDNGSSTDLAVVGAGITGLAAAWEAVERGLSVTIIDSGRVGGVLGTHDLEGIPVDDAADMFLTRVPDAINLVAEVGMSDELVAPDASGAAVWRDGAARSMPSGLVLGVPTDPDGLAGHALVGDGDVARLRAELSRTETLPDGDISLGALLRDRFGDGITDRLVAPILGGINAGVLDKLSLDSVAPQLAAAARSSPSMAAGLAAARRAENFDPATAAPPTPAFLRPVGGMARLAERLRTLLAERGVEFRDAGISHVSSGVAGILARTTAGDSLHARRAVLAIPARHAALLLESTAPETARLLADWEYASVAMVRVAVRPEQVDAPPGRAGLLVPHTEGLRTTAVSYASTKWPELGRDGLVRLRISVGHDGDPDTPRLTTEEIERIVLSEAATLTSLEPPFEATSTVRWLDAFPQYRVDHADRCDAVDDLLERDLPTVALAGASYRGLGLPACIRQGRTAVARLTE